MSTHLKGISGYSLLFGLFFVFAAMKGYQKGRFSSFGGGHITGIHAKIGIWGFSLIGLFLIISFCFRVLQFYRVTGKKVEFEALPELLFAYIGFIFFDSIAETTVSLVLSALFLIGAIGYGFKFSQRFKEQFKNE